MKTKKIISVLCIFAILSGIMTGCFNNTETETETDESYGIVDSNNEETTSPTNNEDVNIDTNNTITIAELKEKYGESDTGKLLPLYNIDAHEPLSVSVKYTPTDERALFSIHTDEKCLPESEVSLMWGYSSYSSSGPKTYEVRPIMGALSYNRDNEGYWGNVSTYYIKFNYDISAKTETKLDTPVIVPMSIKSEVEIPNVSYKIQDGNFILTWSAVEDATSYKIYNCSKRELLSTTNIQPNGKEVAYKANIPSLVAEVDANTLQFQDWLDNGENGMTPIPASDVVGGYIISRQNQGVNGEYYVTAVVDGKESLFSIGINTCKMNLPAEIKGYDSILGNTYNTMSDLPKTISILYVDGSTAAHSLSYETKAGVPAITYKVDGTSMTGFVQVKSGEQTLPADINNSQNTNGFIEIENNIPQNAPTDLPTINDGKATEEEKPNVSEDINDKPITEQQVENTEEVLEEANKETVKVKDGMIVNASSAAEEYLALSMISGEQNISIAAFPELQNWSILTDILCKVIYQNPMILGVKSYAYNYGTMTLTIEYKYTTEEITTRQEEIIEEGTKIIEDIITSGMTDAEKRRAIYDYLEANTSYDDDALEDAENNNYRETDSKYRDSFSTYGILVKKVGVCQSYAYVYDYLCELADVDCIMVTGDMYGYLPHAWNKVKIGNEWFVIDVTNNEKTTGVDDFMYENPDQIATALGYVENETYYTIDESGKYVSSSTQYSKYKDCMVDSVSSLEEYIKQHAKKNTTIEFVATYEDFCSDDIVNALRKTSVIRIGDSIIIGGYVWFEIIE